MLFIEMLLSECPSIAQHWRQIAMIVIIEGMTWRSTDKYCAYVSPLINMKTTAIIHHYQQDMPEEHELWFGLIRCTLKSMEEVGVFWLFTM